MEDFIQGLFEEHNNTPKCPVPAQVVGWFNSLLGGLFPGICERRFDSPQELAAYFSDLETALSKMLDGHCPMANPAPNLAQAFFNALPKIKNLLQKDVEALYAGDPAAQNHAEITRSYPGFYAIAAHRVAHELHGLGVQIIPRMISENAHTVTGVDIHPGASIGEYFCIDHGTGVVVGETTVIGNHVKIYQGVTLGALSVNKEDASSKRHPTIEDGVVIYAGATILGGLTTVGKNSVIGGSVWITKSVPAESKIYYKASMSDTQGNTDTITFKP